MNLHTLEVLQMRLHQPALCKCLTSIPSSTKQLLMTCSPVPRQLGLATATAMPATEDGIRGTAAVPRIHSLAPIALPLPRYHCGNATFQNDAVRDHLGQSNDTNAQREFLRPFRRLCKTEQSFTTHRHRRLRTFHASNIAWRSMARARYLRETRSGKGQRSRTRSVVYGMGWKEVNIKRTRRRLVVSVFRIR